MSVLGGPPRYLLPFDHRASFKSGLLGITGEPVETQRRPVSDLKSIIYEGFTQALAEGAPGRPAAVLDACREPGPLSDRRFLTLDPAISREENHGGPTVGPAA